jgi:hypothetical protein
MDCVCRDVKTCRMAMLLNSHVTASVDTMALDGDLNMAVYVHWKTTYPEVNLHD